MIRSILILALVVFSSQAYGQYYGSSPLQKGIGGGGATGMSTMAMSFNETQTYEGKLKSARTLIDQGDYPGGLEILESAKKEKETGKLYEYFGDAFTFDREYTKAFNSYLKSMDLYLSEGNKKKAEKMYLALKFYQTDDNREIIETAKKRISP